MDEMNGPGEMMDMGMGQQMPRANIPPEHKVAERMDELNHLHLTWDRVLRTLQRSVADDLSPDERKRIDSIRDLVKQLGHTSAECAHQIAKLFRGHSNEFDRDERDAHRSSLLQDVFKGSDTSSRPIVPGESGADVVEKIREQVEQREVIEPRPRIGQNRIIKLTEQTLRELTRAVAIAHEEGLASVLVTSDFKADAFDIAIDPGNLQESCGYHIGARGLAYPEPGKDQLRKDGEVTT